MPANAELDGNEMDDSEEQDAPTSRPEARSVQRSRLNQELYAEPSRELAQSKEALIRQEHALEAKRLKQQALEMDRAAKEAEGTAREAVRAESWRRGHISRAFAAAPAEVWPNLRDRIEDLLNSVTPCTDVTSKVNELIQLVMRPIKQREEQALAAAAHRERIARVARSVRVPFGATSDESTEAGELALEALTQMLPMGATDRLMKSIAEAAIQPVVDRVKLRRAASERKLQAESHKRRINEWVSAASVGMVLAGATSEETDQAKRAVRTALEELSVTTTGADLRAANDRALAPFRAAIQERKDAAWKAEAAASERQMQALRSIEHAQRANLHLFAVVTTLRELEVRREIVFEDFAERRDFTSNLKRLIQPIVADEIGANPAISDAQIRKRIGELVYEHYEELCD